MPALPAGSHKRCGKPSSPPPGGNVKLARPPCWPGPRPWPSASNVRTRLIPWSTGCPTRWCARCPRAPGPTRCTASRSASRPTPRWCGCRLAAGPRRSCSRRSAAPNARPACSSRPGSPAPRPPRPPGWPTGRRCTGTSSGSAWCTPCARAVRPRCSSARWRPGRPAGPATAGCFPPPGSPSPPSGPTWAGIWRCGSARAPATPTRSVTCPEPAGTTCAPSPNCPTGARPGASSATCPCWCTGRKPRSACCQTGARISVDPCIRAGSSLSGTAPASSARGTDPPSCWPAAPSCTDPPPLVSHPSRPA
jgi:hypothetical protein